MKLSLDTPVAAITQVGRVSSNKLKKIGIQNIRDLIFYYPFRYEDFSQISNIEDLQPFTTVTVKAKIELLSNRRSWKKHRTITEGLIADRTGSIKVIWFNQPFLTKVLRVGDEVYFSGKVNLDPHNLQLVNPVYEKAKASGETIHTARLVPIYPVTEKLTQKQIRFLIKMALNQVDEVRDWLPQAVRDENNLLSLARALVQIHFPEDKKKLDEAIRRLKFDELFLFLIQFQTVKHDLNKAKAVSVKFREQETKDFVSHLPFTLTDDQRKAAWQILQDLQKSSPMNRLLEGDVGSGKTVVAAMAIYNAALNYCQSVLMAPTEILAIQHFKNLRKLFQDIKLSDKELNVAILTRSNQIINGEQATKNKILSQLRRGKIDFIVGTHALIQESIEFHNLALAVIDEQHRFGVEQRKLLSQKGLNKDFMPHFLSMTATPIPRSLALTLYGDLDLSVIRQLPKERKKIITQVIEPTQRQWCYDFIRQQINQGRQAFVICPLIDPSDKLGIKSVNEEYKKLKEQIFPDLNIEVLHGKLKSADKEKIMVDFLANRSQILVATSVIEVGIDVPNASVMLIEGAERFGLAQLHQFRGRVGRGQYQSYCFLAADKFSLKTQKRLQALITAKDAFELAELDLDLRGPGEIFGVSQSGWPEFKIASLFDQPIISLARSAAQEIVKHDPLLNKYPFLKEKINELNLEVHLE